MTNLYDEIIDDEKRSAAIAARRATLVKGYTEVAVINPRAATGCGFMVQLRLRGIEPEQYWFEFWGVDGTGLPLTEDEAAALDDCLRMRVFYNEIEKVTLVARYCANADSVRVLRQMESFDED